MVNVSMEPGRDREGEGKENHARRGDMDAGRDDVNAEIRRRRRTSGESQPMMSFC